MTLSIELTALQHNTEMLHEAARLIARAVALLTPEQVGELAGVRAWQETYETVIIQPTQEVNFDVPKLRQ